LTDCGEFPPGWHQVNPAFGGGDHIGQGALAVDEVGEPLPHRIGAEGAGEVSLWIHVDRKDGESFKDEGVSCGGADRGFTHAAFIGRKSDHGGSSHDLMMPQ